MCVSRDHLKTRCLWVNVRKKSCSIRELSGDRSPHARSSCHDAGEASPSRPESLANSSQGALPAAVRLPLAPMLDRLRPNKRDLALIVDRHWRCLPQWQELPPRIYPYGSWRLRGCSERRTLYWNQFVLARGCRAGYGPQGNHPGWRTTTQL